MPYEGIGLKAFFQLDLLEPCLYCLIMNLLMEKGFCLTFTVLGTIIQLYNARGNDYVSFASPWFAPRSNNYTTESGVMTHDTCCRH